MTTIDAHVTMVTFKVLSLLSFLYSKVATTSMNYKEVNLLLVTSSRKKNKFKDF